MDTRECLVGVGELSTQFRRAAEGRVIVGGGEWGEDTVTSSILCAMLCFAAAALATTPPTQPRNAMFSLCCVPQVAGKCVVANLTRSASCDVEKKKHDLTHGVPHDDGHRRCVQSVQVL